MKKSILSLLFLLSFFSTVYAENHNLEDNQEQDNFKFGLHGALLMPHIGVFGECKFSKKIGLQIAFLRGRNFTILKRYQDLDVVGFSYVAIPVVLRVYPGSGRQFCLSFGGQINYLLGDSAKTLDLETGEKKLYPLRSNWATYFVAGIDYEFSSGFQLRFDINQRLTKLLREESTYISGGSRISIGYNFAKLL